MLKVHQATTTEPQGRVGVVGMEGSQSVCGSVEGSMGMHLKHGCEFASLMHSNLPREMSSQKDKTLEPSPEPLTSESQPLQELNCLNGHTMQEAIGLP